MGTMTHRTSLLLARVEELERENEALRRNLEASTARLNESLYQRSRLQSQIDALNKAADDMTRAFDRQFSASEEMAGRLLLADEENEALRKAYWKMRNAAAGYSNFCEDSASTRRCERDYEEAESMFRAMKG